MSLFDFVKDAGRQIFDKDGIEEDRIEELVNRVHPTVKGCKAEYDDGEVTLTGSCDSEQTQQRVAMLVGNVMGVTAVNAKGLTFPKPTAEEKAAAEFKIYEIKSGDSLGAIAKEFYGDASKYTVIFEANKEVIEDPDKIYPGQSIRIPAKVA